MDKNPLFRYIKITGEFGTQFRLFHYYTVARKEISELSELRPASQPQDAQKNCAPVSSVVRPLEAVSALVHIREERPEDVVGIRDLNERAFGQSQEANVIEALRENGGVLLSLLATIDGQVVGHVLYSPVSVGSDEKKLVGAGLGPMAVLPEHQRKGIGTKLIEFGNKRLQEGGFPFIVVLGHPGYYPRFGFRPASCYGIRCE